MKKLIIIGIVLSTITMNDVNYITAKSSSVTLSDVGDFVTDNQEFPNGELIFTDKYSVTVEQGNNKNYLVVYNIDPADVASGDIDNHFKINSSDYSFAFDVPLGCNYFSTLEYSVKPLNASVNSEISGIVFFIKNEYASWNEDDYFSIPEKSEWFGFDICPYIFPHYYTGNCKVGDINGDGYVSATDSAKTLQLYSFFQTQTDFELHEKQTEYADLNNDKLVTASDAALILSAYAQSQVS